MNAPPTPFARLPWELVRRIITIAADTSRQSALQLCPTAEWVDRLTRPRLLRTTVMKNIQHFHTLAMYLAETQASLGTTRAAHVRHAWMDSSVDASDMATTLRLCDKLEHIAIPAQSFPGLVVATTAFTPAIQPLPLSRGLHLTLFDTATHPAWFTGFLVFNRSKDSLLSHVTHLRLVETGAYRDCMPAHYYPVLSHVMVPYRGAAVHDLHELDRFLALESLKVLAIEIVPGALSAGDKEAFESWVRLVRATDQRVQVVERASDDIQRDWECEMRGGEDIWDRAACHPLSLEAPKRNSALGG